MRRVTIAGIMLLGFLVAVPMTGVHAQIICPGDSLLGQQPTPPPGPRIWASDEAVDLVVSLGGATYSDLPVPYDDYSVSAPIGELVWWGTELTLAQTVAERYAPLFTITFYTNDTTSNPEPMPGTVAAQYANLLVTKVDTGVRHVNPNTLQFDVPLFRYTVVLPTPVTLTEGWLNIKGALAGSVNPLNPSDPAGVRAFVHISSSVGNQNMREFDGVNLPYRVRTGDRRDTAICLLPEKVAVPDVVGEQLADAEDDLIAAGLIVGTITLDYSGAVPAGQVISQDPTAGAQVVAGTAVNLVVAADPIIVPYVVGMMEAAAAAELTGAGLTVGTITQVYSDTAPEGQVISQGIAAGTPVPPGTAVNLAISRGPEPTVPAGGLTSLMVLTAALAGLGMARFVRRRK